MTCEKNAVCGCPAARYLSSLFVWNAKLHNLHWNVVGRAFVQVHEYTEKVYDEVFEQYDAVAEAMKMRGKLPPVRVADFAANSVIEELDSAERPVPDVVAEVYADMQKMQKLAEEVRAAADGRGDNLLAAQFDEYLAWYAKQLWFLSAMLKQ